MDRRGTEGLGPSLPKGGKPQRWVRTEGGSENELVEGWSA